MLQSNYFFYTFDFFNEEELTKTKLDCNHIESLCSDAFEQDTQAGFHESTKSSSAFANPVSVQSALQG